MNVDYLIDSESEVEEETEELTVGRKRNRKTIRSSFEKRIREDKETQASN